MAEELPNITGYFGKMRTSWTPSIYSAGPFTVSEDGNSMEWGGSGNTNVFKVTLNLGQGNAIYGGNHVTPLSETVTYLIRY